MRKLQSLPMSLTGWFLFQVETLSISLKTKGKNSIIAANSVIAFQKVSTDWSKTKWSVRKISNNRFSHVFSSSTGSLLVRTQSGKLFRSYPQRCLLFCISQWHTQINAQKAPKIRKHWFLLLGLLFLYCTSTEEEKES